MLVDLQLQAAAVGVTAIMASSIGAYDFCA